jgi:hypothetical protein
LPDNFQKWIASAEDDNSRSYTSRNRFTPGAQPVLMQEDGTPLIEIDDGTFETRTRRRLLVRLIGEWTSEHHQGDNK